MFSYKCYKCLTKVFIFCSNYFDNSIFHIERKTAHVDDTQILVDCLHKNCILNSGSYMSNF